MSERLERNGGNLLTLEKENYRSAPLPLYSLLIPKWTGVESNVGRDSSVSLRKGWSGDRIPGGGGRFPAPVQTGPGAHPASCKVYIKPLSRA